MNLSPYSYNTTLLNSGSYITVMSSSFNTEIEIVSIARADETPAYGGKNIGGSRLFLTLTLAAGANIPQQMGLLSAIFNHLDTTLYQLIVKDVDDSNRQWYVYATPAKSPTFEGTEVTIELYVADPVWRVVTNSTNTWSVTASGQTRALTVLGNVKAYPKIKVTPKLAKTGGYAYKQFICIWNNSVNAIANYALDVTGSTGKQLNTAALVTALKMQADLDDVRLVVDARETMYWLTGANTTTTGIHTAEIKLSPKIEMTLSGAMGTGAISSITCKATAANNTALKVLATVSNKVIAIKTGANIEIFMLPAPSRLRVMPALLRLPR